DKPPALFALAALSIRALGHVPLAARVPAMLASIVTLLLIARAARRIEDEDFAWRAMALFAASPLAAILAAYCLFDMPLTACVTAVWTLNALELSRGPSRRRRAGM